MSTYDRNLILTLVIALLAAYCVWRGEQQVALACVAFIGGLWLRSGRVEDRGRIAMLALVLLAGCKLEYSLSGILTDQVTMTPQASPTCSSGKACLYAKSSDSLTYFKDANGLELQTNAARAFRPSASCSGLSSPALGDVCYDTGGDAFYFYTGSGWTTGVINDALVVHKAGTETITGAKTFSATLTMNGATIAMGSQKITGLATPTVSTDAATKGYVDGLTSERAFVRTCTLTSAAATTPVNCLSNADVPSTQKPYLAGWHAKINGATNWATTANCWIQDTSGTSNIFVTVGVAAMTGNSFLGDHSANVTQNNPYALGTGGTADLGLEIACDANGTGSNWVVTLFGVIK